MLSAVGFGVSFWLGLYLLKQDARAPLLRRAALGLLFYAAALMLSEMAQGAPSPWLGWLARALLWWPALFWVGALLCLLPDAQRANWERGWQGWVLLLGGLLSAQALLSGALGIRVPRWLALLALLAVVGPLLAVAARVWWARRGVLLQEAAGVLAVTTLFFALGVGLLVIPLGLPRPLVLLAIGGDLLVLGLAIGWLDAFDLGEAFWPDLLRSASSSVLAALLFSGQVGLVILVVGGAEPLRWLLFGTLAAAIFASLFAAPLQDALDRALLPAEASRQRTALRAVEGALPRRGPASPLFDDAEKFARLTRRALGHYNDLPRLVASPLTTLSALDARLAARGVEDNPLERASELKVLLAESIERLKPPDEADFGTSDEWRYYNALYFPYVIGLRPYSHRATHDDLDPAAREALTWFRSQVPPRTLYNWQNKAAELVALDLIALHEKVSQTPNVQRPRSLA